MRSERATHKINIFLVENKETPELHPMYSVQISPKTKRQRNLQKMCLLLISPIFRGWIENERRGEKFYEKGLRPKGLGSRGQTSA